jgi:hypothetical protein
MRAVFLADGPAFRDGLVVESFQNIHIYPLLAHVLGLKPAPTDGRLDSVRVMLAPGRTCGREDGRTDTPSRLRRPKER